METLKAIFSRRSIRKFESKHISEDQIQTLLRAAMVAPTAGDQRPWHFVVLDDRSVLDVIPTVHPYAQMLKQAPLAILIAADLALEKHKGYWIQDCAAATQNLLLAAHDMGLGAVWLGIHPRADREKGVRELLGLPEQVMPLSMVAIGYPAEEKSGEDRYAEDRVHRNHW